MTLIKRILEWLEHECKGDYRALEVPTEINGYELNEIRYHVGLCIQAGFIEGNRHQLGDTLPHYDVVCLTWEGHEKLAELRKSGK